MDNEETKSMNSTPKKTSNWLVDAQDKKDPKSCLPRSTRAREESDGAGPSSSGNNIPTEANLENPQSLEIRDSGLQSTPNLATERMKKRGLKSKPWTVAEKKVLLYCYHYSMFEKWSNTSNQVLKEKISNTDLPIEKREYPF